MLFRRYVEIGKRTQEWHDDFANKIAYGDVENAQRLLKVYDLLRFTGVGLAAASIAFAATNEMVEITPESNETALVIGAAALEELIDAGPGIVTAHIGLGLIMAGESGRRSINRKNDEQIHDES